MRILLIAVGSRGDAEPFCSLAASLAKSEEIDAVDLYIQKDLKHLVPQGDASCRQKIEYHELPFTQMDFYKYAGERKPPQPGAGHPNPRVQFLGIVTDIMGEMVLPCFSDIMDRCTAGKSSDAIVGSSLARQLVLELAGQLERKVPVYLVQLQSLVPTQDFPHYSQHEKCLDALVHHKGSGSPENVDTYLELERIQADFLEAHVKNKLHTLDGYKQNRSMDFEQDTIPALTGQKKADRDIWMVNAVSTHIIPPPSDAGPKVLNVGGLADHFIPAGFEPPSDLVSYLEEIKKNSDGIQARPICFGYGSMPFGKVVTVVEALHKTKRPAILVGSAMIGVLEKIQTEHNDSDEFVGWVRKNIKCVTSVPYGWLLPKCSMMFSHGGAGVLHATLRAGIPSVISPLIGDQFLFADYVQAKGWGVRASKSLGALTKTDIMESIQKAELCQNACEVLGSEMTTGEPSGSNSGKFGPELLTQAIVAQAGCAK